MRLLKPLLLCALWLPGLASADCAPGAAGLAWSFPPNGETGVATDLAIVAVPTWGHPVRIVFDTANEEWELVPAADSGPERFVFRMEDLDPETDYHYTIEIGEQGAGTIKKIQRKFTTGTEAHGETASKVVGVSVVSIEDAGDYSPTCAKVQAAQECYDTPVQSIQIEPEGAGLGFLVTSPNGGGGLFYPSECAPRVSTLDSDPGASACWDLATIDLSGGASETVTICPFDPNFTFGDGDGGGGGGRGSSGCSAGGAGDGPAPIALLLLLAIGLRVTARTRGARRCGSA